jgi:hypothetical protein
MSYLRKPEGEAERVTVASAAFEAAVAVRNALPKDEAGALNFERAKSAGKSFDDDSNFDGRSERYQAAQDAVHAAYGAMRDAEGSYFRLNIFGMGEYARLMETFGMVFEAGPYPEWPHPGPYGTTDEIVEQVRYPEYSEGKPPLSDEDAANARRYIAAHESVLAWHPEESLLDEDSAIPAHKFSTNDGWIVTPAECRAAVKMWREACELAGAGEEEIGRKVLTGAMDENGMGGDYWMKWVAWIEGAIEHDGFCVN